MLDHGGRVGAWLQHAAVGLSPEEEIALFERALNALWHRARKTLGELTLATIVDRVLNTTSVKHPVVAGLRLEANTVTWDALRERAGSLPEGLARAALSDLLVNWLTVVGNLTAEILTPALYETLEKVTLQAPAVEGEETP